VIVVDTSALIAVFFNEPERMQFAALIRDADRACISAVNWVEACVVGERTGSPALGARIEDQIRDFFVEIAPVSAEQSRLALSAYRRFGKGNHPARLNLADCFAYALAIEMNAPLLFKGDDFGHTGVRSALQ
jgi:ribonuclease VapC